tara:strand:+ start:412 stop:792 length:381 start_codon:yes stop_codon:yes gene_type:complete
MDGTSSYSRIPLRMTDGRVMTDYRPKCIVNSDLIETVGANDLVKSSYETRIYLQKNAESIMKSEFEKTKSNLIPGVESKQPVGNNNTLPEKFLVTCNATSCSRKLFNENGLGDGRTVDYAEYNNSE